VLALTECLQGDYVGSQGTRISVSRNLSASLLSLAFSWIYLEGSGFGSSGLTWELVPEKVGSDKYSTLGLNVSPECPYYDDGHVFVMLEWTNSSISVLHGPGGETFTPDISKPHTSKPQQHSAAISKMSDMLKMLMCLDALKSRCPFPAWLVEEAVSAKDASSPAPKVAEVAQAACSFAAPACLLEQLPPGNLSEPFHF
jgi:hypothetical protein